MAVGEGEVGEGGAGRGQSEEADVTQFLAVGEVQFPQSGTEGALSYVTHTEV